MSKPLSPAADAVDDAAYVAWVREDGPRDIAAATLRAAANQTEGLIGDTPHPRFAEGVFAVGKFLERIATELEAP